MANDIKISWTRRGHPIASWGIVTMLIAPLGTTGLRPALPSSTNGGWTYPQACCHGDHNSGECDRIPTDAVTETDGGWTIVLRPGDHRAITERHRYFIPYGKELPSGDNSYHICLYPTERDVNCFFAPPGSI